MSISIRKISEKSQIFGKEIIHFQTIHKSKKKFLKIRKYFEMNESVGCSLSSTQGKNRAKMAIFEKLQINNLNLYIKKQTKNQKKAK